MTTVFSLLLTLKHCDKYLILTSDTISDWLWKNYKWYLSCSDKPGNNQGSLFPALQEYRKYRNSQGWLLFLYYRIKTRITSLKTRVESSHKNIGGNPVWRTTSMEPPGFSCNQALQILNFKTIVFKKHIL